MPHRHLNHVPLHVENMTCSLLGVGIHRIFALVHVPFSSRQRWSGRLLLLSRRSLFLPVVHSCWRSLRVCPRYCRPIMRCSCATLSNNGEVLSPPGRGHATSPLDSVSFLKKITTGFSSHYDVHICMRTGGHATKDGNRER